MTLTVLSWLFAIPVLGLVTGLRSMTPMAVIAWFAYFGYLPVSGSWAAWVARLPVVILLTLGALGEYIGDKLPRVPNRTSPGPLVFRLLMGGLAGAIVAVGINGSGLEAVLLGVAGALVGSFLGFHCRRDLVSRFHCRDWPIALTEDAIAILLSLLAIGIITG